MNLGILQYVGENCKFQYRMRNELQIIVNSSRHLPNSLHNQNNMQKAKLTQVILSKPRSNQVPAQILDILWSGCKEVNGFEMRHGFSGLGNGVNQFHQKHFFLKKLGLRIRHTHYTNLHPIQLTEQPIIYWIKICHFHWFPCLRNS